MIELIQNTMTTQLSIDPLGEEHTFVHKIE